MANDAVLPGLYVDGYDCSLLGFQLSELQGWRGMTEQKRQTKDVPGRWGPVDVSGAPVYKQRVMRLDGTLLADNLATLIANLHTLKYRFGKTVRTWEFEDDTAYEFYGSIKRVRERGIRPHLSQTAVSLQIEVECLDPRIYEASDTVISGITTSDVDLPLGTAPSHAVISVAGAAAATMAYKDSVGGTVKTFYVVGTPASTLSIDMSTGVIRDGSGNGSDHMGDTSDFPFPFDPDDGDYPTSDWPTLTIAAGTATATYRKAYL